MSYYSQSQYGGYGGNSGAVPNQSAGLQFLPSQFDSSTSAFSAPTGTMNSGYNAGGSSTGYSYGGDNSRERLSTGLLAAFGTSGYIGEPPLLEELGFNFTHIKQKTLTVLNPLREIDQNIMADSDLAGPILFCLLFGTFLLLSGKVHFGYIYGSALIGTVSQYIILNLMSSFKSIDFTRVASVLGYCMLPLVLNSALGVIVNMDNALGYITAALSIAWCTYSSSAIFVAVLQLSEMRVLVAYPLALFYGVFSIMTIFAEEVV